MPDRPQSPPDHTADFAYRYSLDLDAYCVVRMEELGIPECLHGTRDLEGDDSRRAFIAHNSQGGSLLEGIAVNSGWLNPQLLKGKQGARVYARSSLRDRIDAIIAHEIR